MEVELTDAAEPSINGPERTRESAYAYALESWVVEAEDLLRSIAMEHVHLTGVVEGLCPACMGMDRLRSAVETVKEFSEEVAL